MASFTLSLLEHEPLLCASDGSLDNDASPRGDFLGFDGNLLGQFSRGRNDNGPDVVGPGALVASDPFAELWVVLDDTLDDGDEETQRLTSTSLCLCNAGMRQSVFSQAQKKESYTSTPLKASLMVLLCTSVMVLSLICLVMVLMRLGWTSPRVARSLNSVISSCCGALCSASCATACCHFALWWKPEMAAFARRDDCSGIRRRPGV